MNCLTVLKVGEDDTTKTRSPNALPEKLLALRMSDESEARDVQIAGAYHGSFADAYSCVTTTPSIH